ncbi:DUF1707 domain-containing protein [Naumannella sp. ID2617S]|nr:DUF1707 domain-containing protein [Naumannella sp. ID2617S]
MASPQQMRAGNDDRERVIQTLQQAYADGRLTADELRERAARTHGAQTFGELDAVVADLPVPPPSAAQQSGAVAPVAPAGAPVVAGTPGSSMENPLILDGGWWAESRKGPWEIPQHLLLRGGAGMVTLNCLEATTPHQVIHVWVEGGMGMITVVVPDGWAVDTRRLAKSMGMVTNRVADTPTGGRPTMVVNGSGGMGTITFRHPNWFERRAAKKNLR